MRNVASEADSRCFSSSSLSCGDVLEGLVRRKRGTPICWYSCAKIMPSRRLSIPAFEFSLLAEGVVVALSFEAFDESGVASPSVKNRMQKSRILFGFERLHCSA